MKISSSAIINGVLQDKYGNLNQDKAAYNEYDIPQISFPIEWDEVPEGTKSFALQLMDYDNTDGEGMIWIHWLASEIDGNIRSLPENAANDPSLVQGVTSWDLPYGPYSEIPAEACAHYGGPSPDCTHQYVLTLYALSEPLNLKQGFYYKEMYRKLQGRVLDQVTLAMDYG